MKIISMMMMMMMMMRIMIKIDRVMMIKVMTLRKVVMGLIFDGGNMVIKRKENKNFYRGCGCGSTLEDVGCSDSILTMNITTKDAIMITRELVMVMMMMMMISIIMMKMMRMMLKMLILMMRSVIMESI